MNTKRDWSSNFVALLLFFGATAGGAQVWGGGNQLLVRENPTDIMKFGAVEATGDFNGDGVSDLAVSDPWAPNGDLGAAGRVTVHLGGANGLDAAPSFTRTGFQHGQQIGMTLAAGDFNGDGRDELVIGMPETDLGPNFDINAAGLVEVWKMTAAGSWVWSSMWSQDEQGVLGAVEEYDRFGAALAVGDFDADSFDDLAVGVPAEDIGEVPAGGAVHVLYGGVNGLSSAENQLWYRGGGGVAGDLDNLQYLGRGLAAGNFDGYGGDDLAIGIASDMTPITGILDGSVAILFGIQDVGLVAAGQQRFDREILGRLTPGDSNSYFGEVLAAGDLDRSLACVEDESCADDLVVGAKSAEVAGEAVAGAVYVMFGNEAAGGLTTAGNIEITQAIYGPVGGTPPEEWDQFGTAIAVGSLNEGSRADLVIGTPYENLFGIQYPGCVHVVLHVNPGLDTEENPEAQYFWPQPGLAAAPPTINEHFGTALAIGDFNGDGWGDLAVGVEGYHYEGAVQVLFGALFADGFESQGTAHWSN